MTLRLSIFNTSSIRSSYSMRNDSSMRSTSTPPRLCRQQTLRPVHEPLKDCSDRQLPEAVPLGPWYPRRRIPWD